MSTSKTNKIYGYAEIPGFTVPDITKLQSNFYPMAIRETFLLKRKLSGNVSIVFEKERTPVIKEFKAYYGLTNILKTNSTHNTTVDLNSIKIEIGQSSKSLLNATLQGKLFVRSDAWQAVRIGDPPVVRETCFVYTASAKPAAIGSYATIKSKPRNIKRDSAYSRFFMYDYHDATVTGKLRYETSVKEFITDESALSDLKLGENVHRVTSTKYGDPNGYSSADNYELQVKAPISVYTNIIYMDYESELTIYYPTLILGSKEIHGKANAKNINYDINLEINAKPIQFAPSIQLSVIEKLVSGISDPDKLTEGSVSANEKISSQVFGVFDGNQYGSSQGETFKSTIEAI